MPGATLSENDIGNSSDAPQFVSHALRTLQPNTSITSVRFHDVSFARHRPNTWAAGANIAIWEVAGDVLYLVPCPAHQSAESNGAKIEGFGEDVDE